MGKVSFSRGFLRMWQQKLQKIRTLPVERAQLMRAENCLKHPNDLTDGGCHFHAAT